MISAWSGNYREAEDFYQIGLRALGDDSRRQRCGLMGFPAVMVRARLAETLAEHGEFWQGLVHAQAALRIAEELDHPYSSLMAWHSLGVLYGAQGALPLAANLLERGLSLSDRWNLTVWPPTLSIPLGRVYALMGRSSEAISMLRSTTQQFESMYGRAAPNCMINLGGALLRAGQLDEALSLARRALAIGRDHGQQGIESWALHLIAEIAGQPGGLGFAESESHYAEALTRAEVLGMRPLAARCHLGLGRLYRSVGKPVEARREIYSAADMLRSMEMTFWLEQTESELAAL